MSTRKVHCADCLKALGKEWDCVHAWLDGLACIKGKLNHNHRRWRHHEEGIEEVRLRWGDEAAIAAALHIMRDFGGSVPTRAQVEDMYDEEPFLTDFPNSKPKKVDYLKRMRNKDKK